MISLSGCLLLVYRNIIVFVHCFSILQFAELISYNTVGGFITIFYIQDCVIYRLFCFLFPIIISFNFLAQLSWLGPSIKYWVEVMRADILVWFPIYGGSIQSFSTESDVSYGFFFPSSYQVEDIFLLFLVCLVFYH